MGLRLVLIGSLLGLLTDAPAIAADRTLSVTIYAGDLALVQDRRDVEIKGGRQRLEFQDVSAQIRPETVSLTAADISIVEQNFDFDLLTPAKLMEKAVGRQITIVRVNPATGAETREQAQVLATNGGVVLKIGERIEVLRDDGLPVRVIFDQVPENLRAHPTLSVTVVGSHAGVRPATLSYLTPGLGWRADYVALYNEGDSKIDVQGWVTLTNSSGVTYDNAQTLLVAGSPTQVDGGARPPNYYRNPQTRATLQQAGTETGSRERLGDYYLYPLAERTTIANLQTKQVSFLDVHGVPAEHGYEYRNRWLGTSETPQSAKSVYSFFDRRARRFGRSAAGGSFALLHARQTRRAAVHRRGPHRPHPHGIDSVARHRRRLRCESARRGGEAHAPLHLQLAVRHALRAQQCPAPARHRQTASRGVMGRFAHHRREPEEHTAQCRDRRVGGDRARERQGQSHRQLRDAFLGAMRWAALAWALAAAPAAAADILASPPTDVSVTVYRAPDRGSGSIDLDELQGFALISETRTVHLPAGLSQLRFEGVADGIEPASAIVTGLPAGVIEKNREGKLLSPSALIGAARAKPVTLLRTDKKTGRLQRLSGTLISDAGGGVVFETAEGIEALRCSGLPETFSFTGVAGLNATPALSVLVHSSEASTRTVTCRIWRGASTGRQITSRRYRATASQWTSGAWVTLANGNGVGFPAARTQVVAGRVNREEGDDDDAAPLDAGRAIFAQCWPRGSTSDAPESLLVADGKATGQMDQLFKSRTHAGGRRQPALQEVAVTAMRRVQQEQLGDLKLYRVPDRTTVASRQSKQVRLLDRLGIPVDRVFGADLAANQDAAAAASMLLRTLNDAAHHLGLRSAFGTHRRVCGSGRAENPAARVGDARLGGR